MDDLKFHHCVDLNKFESDRAIEFTPPDGEFELMNYRLNMEVNTINIIVNTHINITYFII